MILVRLRSCSWRSQLALWKQINHLTWISFVSKDGLASEIWRNSLKVFGVWSYYISYIFQYYSAVWHHLEEMTLMWEKHTPNISTPCYQQFTPWVPAVPSLPLTFPVTSLLACSYYRAGMGFVIAEISSTLPTISWRKITLVYPRLKMMDLRYCYNLWN